MLKDKQILKILDQLLSVAGNKFGPILLDELHLRLSKTVKTFDLELKEMLNLSFKDYHKRLSQVKGIKNSSNKNIDGANQSIDKFSKIGIPDFIKKFDQK